MNDILSVAVSCWENEKWVMTFLGVQCEGHGESLEKRRFGRKSPFEMLVFFLPLDLP